jgi:hypothetical protein
MPNIVILPFLLAVLGSPTTETEQVCLRYTTLKIVPCHNIVEARDFVVIDGAANVG